MRCPPIETRKADAHHHERPIEGGHRLVNLAQLAVSVPQRNLQARQIALLELQLEGSGFDDVGGCHSVASSSCDNRKPRPRGGHAGPRRIGPNRNVASRDLVNAPNAPAIWRIRSLASR